MNLVVFEKIVFHKFQSKNATEAIYRQVLEFIAPVYLVYHDEKKRLDSDVELTKLLLNASVILNATSETAEYFVSIPLLCFLKLIYYDFRLERHLSLWAIFSNHIL